MRFNVSNCNVVANNRVYLLSYSLELFVVLQQHRLRAQSNACDQRAPPRTRPPARPSVLRPPTGPRESLPHGGGAVWWERDERGLEGDMPTFLYAHLPVPPAPHTHTPPRPLHIAPSIRRIGGDNVAVTLAGSRGQCVPILPAGQDTQRRRCTSKSAKNHQKLGNN